LSTIATLPTPVRDRLAAYAELVREWSPRLDLIAPGDLEVFEKRHIEDSLRALPLVESAPGGACVDVGSGSGLPGVPLAIASGRPWRLLEPRRRRAGFLEEVVRSLGLDAEVVALRAEEAASDPRLRDHVVATARAVAPPREALEACRRLVRPGGIVILWIGERSEFPPEAEEMGEGLASIRVESPC
jgi:16S rRNA (guanine527-N7)-methyltransferase